MAKKISSSDLFEQEDLFKGVRDSATKTLAVFNELQAELKATAQGLKSELTANTQASTAQLKQFSAATEQSNKLMQQAVQIEKLKAQADQQKIKAEQEIVKLQKMQAQETARLAKEQEKAAKLAANESSAYAKLSKELNAARKAYKDLAVTNQENTAEGKELLTTITQLDQQLKKVDATVGQHQRNVGNYEGATKSLKLQLRELTQALQQMDESDPRFQEMANQAGELKDRISDTQAVVQATAGTAMENFATATAKAGQVGVAAFQGMESSMVLLGVENEAVLQSMQKLQALAGLADALKTLGGLGDTLTEIRAGFTAAAVKMGLFTSATEANTAAQVANEAVGAGGGAKADLATTIASTAATEADTVATIASTTATEADVAVTATSIATGEADIATTVAGTTATVADTAATVAATAATAADATVIATDTAATISNTAATAAATIATEAQGVATVATTVATTGATGAMKALRIALITSGIGAIVVVLGLAAEAMGLFSDETEEEEKAQKLLERQTKSLEATIESYNRATNAVIQTIDNATRSELALARQRGASQKELTEITKQGAKSRLAALQYENEGLKAEYLKFSKSGTREQYEKAEKAYLESAQKVREAQINIQEIDADIAEQTRENIQSFSQAKTKTVQEIVDLYDQILDEQIKAIQDEDQRAQTQLIVEAERRKKEIQKTVADKKQKATLIKQIEENLVTELDKLDKQYYDKKEQEEKDRLQKQAEEVEWLYNYRKELAEKERQENVKAYQDSVTFEDKQNQAKLASLSGTQREEFEERLQFWAELDKLNKLKQDGAFASQEDYEKAVANLKKKYNKTAEKLEEEKWKTTQEFAQKTTDFLKKQSDERIAQMDKEIAAAEKQADFYRQLAANGNINAQQSLAEQERIIAESNRRKEREQKRQQRMELANTIYQTYAGHAAKDPDTALMKTIKDAGLLQAFISTLPMFYDGTEDTGKGGGIDGKGGFHAVLHPHERVIPKSLNDQIGNLSNEQLTRLAMEYNNGRLVGQDVAHSSMELAILVNEMKDLKEIIKHKPETNIELGQITQSAMEIVQSTRKGNTTVYNRFKVRS